MPLLVLLICAVAVPDQALGFNVTQNKTTPKDMYVVRATVYNIGILTRRSTSKTNFRMGDQEAITFYRSNGSNIDMNTIPQPILTNVTAENVVGVAPVAETSKQVIPWSTLKGFTSLPPQGTVQSLGTSKLFKRASVMTAKIEKGAVMIPKESGVQSIALPPLLTLNNNMSKIPVPIPNVSEVSYAKVNTLVHTLGSN